MEARAKVMGHAVHQMLIVYPLGLFSTAVIFDVIHLITGGATWSIVSYWMIAAGIIGGLCAAVFGTIDWSKIPSWWLRRPDPGNPSVVAIFLMVVGSALSLVTGWLGGELVDRLGVGVDDGAHLDAPSSLSKRPTRELKAPR
jgi:uncharacterized membrane protein